MEKKRKAEDKKKRRLERKQAKIDGVNQDPIIESDVPDASALTDESL